MMNSLLVKAGMLVGTALCVLWIGWPVPDDPLLDSYSPPKETPNPPPVVASTPPTLAPAPPAPVPRVLKSPEVSRAAAASKLDINRASLEELQRLPGVGGVLAHRVIERRRSAGLYRKIEDLQEVKGIGAKRFERLRPLVMISTSLNASPNEPRHSGKAPYPPKEAL